MAWALFQSADPDVTVPADQTADWFVQIWLIATVASTVILAGLSNKALSSHFNTAVGRLNDPGVTAGRRYDFLSLVASFILFVGGVLVAYLVVCHWWRGHVPWEPVIAEALAGPVMVLLVLLFDCYSWAAYDWLHQRALDHGGSPALIADIEKERRDTKVIWKQIDIPIFLGICFAFVISYRMGLADQAGSMSGVIRGFSTGAIAFQLIAGNLAFELRQIG